MSDLDKLVSDALMTGYGYHQEIDWRTDEPVWVKGWAFHKPNPMNEDHPCEAGDDEATK